MYTPVQYLKDDMNMFLNSDGLYLCDGQTEISHWGYADIYRWGGSGRRFSAQMWDAEAQARTKAQKKRRGRSKHGV